MGGWITLGIVVLLALLPLGVSVKYDSEGPRAKLILGPVRLTVFPLPKKEKKANAQAQEDPAQAAKAAEEAALPKPPQPPKAPQEKSSGEKKGGSVTDFIPFVKLAFDFLGSFRRKIRLNNLELKLILASSDPCDLAVSYGRTWAAVGNLLAAMERWFVMKKRNVEVACDFNASETLVTARLDLTISLGRLLSLIAVYGIRGLQEFLNFKKKRKGGAAL